MVDKVKKINFSWLSKENKLVMKDEIKGNQIHETQVNSISMNQEHSKSQSFRKVVKALESSTSREIIERWHVRLWHVHYDMVKEM
jgi:ABC-type metal ion transport system substrate-binding protein